MIYEHWEELENFELFYIKKPEELLKYKSVISSF